MAENNFLFCFFLLELDFPNLSENVYVYEEPESASVCEEL